MVDKKKKKERKWRVPIPEHVLVHEQQPAEFLRPSSGVQNEALSKQSSERYAGRSGAGGGGLWEVMVGMSGDEPGCHRQEVGVTS